MATRMEQLALKKATVEEELRQLHAMGDGTERFERKVRERERIDAEITTLRTRAADLEAMRARGTERPGMPVFATYLAAAQADVGDLPAARETISAFEDNAFGAVPRDSAAAFTLCIVAV